MHITELRLAGFKSFVDPAKAPIEDGLTGVVGPNGCGKSNLLEAVRWVMGATSAKSMRADDMDEVIFAGSAGRPAREHAEVALVLADAIGKAPAPFDKSDELEITRRIRRGLGSTYRINGKEVRAKDVQLLFADAATGANSPALVRQGQVSDLIASKPENRRRIIEDAAGIAGLHARRHEADLKLRAAEANLTRLDEVLAEIEAQAANLRKQARQAERYRSLAETIRQTEALLFHRRWIEAREAAAESQAALRDAERLVADAVQSASEAARLAETARDALPPLREEEMVAAAVLRRLEGVRVGLERDLAEADAIIARADDDARRIAEDIARSEMIEADADNARERLSAELDALGPANGAESEAALIAAESEAAAADHARAAAEAALETRAAEAASTRARAEALAQIARDALTRVARAIERRDALIPLLGALPQDATFDERRADAQKSLELAQGAHAKLREDLANAETALQKASKDDDDAWQSLRKAETAQKELAAEVRALDKLAPPEGAKFPPALSSIDVEPGYERALAAALGDDLDASTHKEAPLRWDGAPKRPLDLPRGAEPLANYVKAPDELAARLALCGIVSDEDGARLIKGATPGVRLVSKDGALWRWDGFVRDAGAPSPAATRLEHKNRLAKARKELARAEEKFVQVKAAQELARAERQRTDAVARALRSEAPKLAAHLAEASQLVERVEAEALRARERRADLEAQKSALETELADAETAAASFQSEAAPTPIDLSDVRAAADAARNRAAEARAALASLTREKQARTMRIAAIESELKDWSRRAQDAKSRRTILEADAKKTAASRAAAADKPDKARAALAALMDQAQTAEERRKRSSDKVAEAETASRAADQSARAADNAHAEAREARARMLAKAESSEQRIADIVQQAQEATSSPPEQLAELAGGLLTTALARAPVVDIERRVDRLRAERDAGGPVNLRAEEELVETQQRVDALAAEKNDVAAAVAKLRGAITRLNNEGRTRLLAAFEIVNTNFTKLFSTLFDGGQAALHLTENEDPLAAGLEIFAQPPGKKLSHLSLMSGGEQALTATALIFAVFLANPAPLCVLDEVDAPLDDANVDRFCRMLDEMKRLTTTRFIVITHNPVTMSRMDRLYGVTMPENGVSQLVSVDLSRAKAMAATA
ncbi:MAG: AAA family ATPase [Caulobacterales bacterium]